MKKLPTSVSKVLVPLVFAGCFAGAGALMYARHVLGHPMVVIRDGEGVLRFKTRRDVLQERLADAHKKLQASPDDKQLQFLYGVALQEVAIEDAKERKKAEEGAAKGSGDGSGPGSLQLHQRPLKDEDLR